MSQVSESNQKKLIIFVKLIAMILVVYLSFAWFGQHYSIGVNVYKNSINSCDPHRFYLISHDLPETFTKGDYVAFDGIDIKGFFKPTYRFTKKIIGLPGDHIRVTENEVYVNDEYITNRPLLARLKKVGLDKYTKPFELTLKPGEFFGLGVNNEKSFDSRYWGSFKKENIKGLILSSFF